MKTSQTPSEQGFNWLSSVRIQVIVFAVLAVLVPISIIQYISITNTRSSFEQEIRITFDEIGRSQAVLLSEHLTEQVNLLELLTDNQNLEQAVVEQNASYADREGPIQADINALDEAWIASFPRPSTFAGQLLARETNQELHEFNALFPDHRELMVTDRYGALVLAAELTSDYNQADEAWWQNAWNNGDGAIFIDSQITFDESIGEYQLTIAFPIEEDGELIGVMRSSYTFNVLQTLLTNAEFGTSGRVLLVNETGEIMLTAQDTMPGTRLEDFPNFLSLSASEILPTIADELGGRSVAVVNPIQSSLRREITSIDGLNWYVVVLQTESEAFVLIRDTFNATLRAAFIVGLMALIIGILAAQRISIPINKLNQAAQELSQGRWNTRVDIRQQNEFGALANSVNLMAEELQNTVGTLERRVENRTRDLQTIIDVNNQIATVLQVERLLQDVVDITKERFGLYHAHIYLHDAESETLVLTAGAGYTGRQMVAEKRSININNPQSIVAQAARSRNPIVTNDTERSPLFLPHPLLPNTRSELAIALVARGRLLGVLDVQSDRPNYFNVDNQSILETLASQISVALNNAQLFEDAERTSRHEQALGNIERQLQSATSIDDVLQIAVRELGKALRTPETAIELSLTPRLLNRQTEAVTSSISHPALTAAPNSEEEPHVIA